MSRKALLGRPDRKCPSPSGPSVNELITVSVVSHGHADMVARLLGQLCETHDGWIGHCIVIHNIAEAPLRAPPQGWPFRFTERFNAEPAGFGANHNRAFALCDSGYFCVLNPDVEMTGLAPWAALAAQAGRPGTGLAYPALLNPDGSRQDNEREAVTPAALLRRHLLGQPERRVDWVSAAFWLVPAPVFRRLRGFDETFFMYCEDTDFCLRLRLAGLVLRRAEAQLLHHARRGSRGPSRLLARHLSSLLRLWSGPVLWRYLAQLN